VSKVRSLVAALVEALVSASPGERASLLEVASAGPEGRRTRRRRLEQLAAMVQEISGELAGGAPDLEPLSASRALGFVAAVYELVERAADDGGPDAIRGLTPMIVELLERLSRPLDAAA
jgi:hypothetical protein